MGFNDLNTRLCFSEQMLTMSQIILVAAELLLNGCHLVKNIGGCLKLKSYLKVVSKQMSLYHLSHFMLASDKIWVFWPFSLGFKCMSD